MRAMFHLIARVVVIMLIVSGIGPMSLFVEAHYPEFVAHLAARECTLSAHVVREFEDYLRCGCLEHGFLGVRCADCHAERLVAFSWPLLRIPAPAALVIPFTS